VLIIPISMVVPNKHQVFCDLMGNSLRSKMVVKLLDGIDITSDELLDYVNKYESQEGQYKKSIINRNLTELKKSGFILLRNEGRNSYWKINFDNKFLSNLTKLMKTPKNTNLMFNNEEKKKKERKTTDEWGEIVMEKINSIVTSRDLHFTPKNILDTGIDISNQRLYQILRKLCKDKRIRERTDKSGSNIRGEYILNSK